MNNDQLKIKEYQEFSIYAIQRGDEKFYKARQNKNTTKPKYDYSPLDGLPNHTQLLENDYSYWVLCARVSNNDILKMKNIYEYETMSEIFHLNTILIATNHKAPEV